MSIPLPGTIWFGYSSGKSLFCHKTAAHVSPTSTVPS